MVVREIVHKVIDQLRGIPTDDNRLRPRRVYSALVSAKARVLKDAIKEVSDLNYTTLDCVPLERTTAYECGCIPAVGCFYHRTTCEITSPVGIGKHIIRRVTTLDGREFSYTEWDRVRLHAYDKYTANTNKYFIRNNRIYLVGATPDLEVVTIVGIFADPVTVRDQCSKCETNTSTNCVSYLDQEFDLDQAYMMRVLELAKMELYANNSEPVQ